MVGCSAFNCSNSSKKGFRFFRFPSNPERRNRWIINCRRQDWNPGAGARLCEIHFEESQFECAREDAWKKLKQDAVPTLFNVPNPPLKLACQRIKGIGLPKPGSLLDSLGNDMIADATPVPKSPQLLVEENLLLKQKNEKLEIQIKMMEKKMNTFLNNEQFEVLGKSRHSISCWSEESLIKSLKLRFALGKHGYEYLRSTGYPAPSYSTLNRRIQNIKVKFGILESIINLLETKVSNMSELDRLCCLSLDEMEISAHQDFDCASKSFVGHATLGKKVLANHYLVVLLRGLKSPWKQIIAHSLTGPSTSGKDMLQHIQQIIKAVERIGVNVVASVSDMGSTNTGMWKAAGVCITRKKYSTTYKMEDKTIHCLADVPHLIKNVRNAFLNHSFTLQQIVCDENDLPSRSVSSGYVKQVWIEELYSTSGLRSLHHLKKCHVFPTHFNKMNVALAVQLFSVKTAAALEKAVRLQQISTKALTTAWFIRVVEQWFHLVTARHRKVGITVRNQKEKFKFLNSVNELFYNTQFGDSWKPIQTGVILTNLTIMNVTEHLFSLGFKFFLPGRLTQDALENVFSQVRRKSGVRPTALQAKSAIKMICVSQFISDVRNSSYASESDYHLFSSVLNNSQCIEKNSDSDVSLNEPSTSGLQHNIRPGKVASEENDIFYIAGSAVNAILKRKNVCNVCKEALTSSVDDKEPDVPKYRQFLTDFCNIGGLKSAPSGVYRVCRETERQIQLYKEDLLAEKISFNKKFIHKIETTTANIVFPSCCRIKEKIISYFFIVRCMGLKNQIIERTSHEKSFSSKSVNKKQKSA